MDQRRHKAELVELVPDDVQGLLGRGGIREDSIFPTPVLLETDPHLVGYYRLLLGVSQKRFYAGTSGYGPLKSMEVSGLLSARQRALLPEFCESIAESMAELVRQISPEVTLRDVQELPILTLGSQLHGSDNNKIGQQAITDVFSNVALLLAPYITKRTDTEIQLTNSANRNVVITVSQDPDLRITEQFGSTLSPKVAMEIKGGSDKSNAHNRAGEAEKSHLKARNLGFVEFWTVIALKGVDLPTLRVESGTTTEWFDVSQVLGREGPGWLAFCDAVARACGVPVSGAGQPG